MKYEGEKKRDCIKVLGRGGIHAMSSVCCEVIYSYGPQDLSIFVDTPPPSFEDIVSAICIASNPVLHNWTKHI